MGLFAQRLITPGGGLVFFAGQKSHLSGYRAILARRQKATGMPRVAVVTPYYREDDAILRQCNESVLAQSHACTHIVVADGHPNPLFDSAACTLHVTLPLSNGDNGNTPRAIGGILAEAQGFDAVVYLDADNWFDPDHIAIMLEGHRRSGHPLVTCKRMFHAWDGRTLEIHEHEEEVYRHVDTSCWLICRPAFHLLRTWLMPKPLSPVCDRVFLQKVLHERLEITAAASRSVHFRSRYAEHYRGAGQVPPPEGSKETAGIIEGANAYLASGEGAAAFERAMGFSLSRL